MNELRPVERAYIAGFFDGEGCVHFRNGRPHLSIAQKDPAVLHKIQGMLGYGSIFQPQGMDKHRYEHAWRLTITRDVYTYHFVRMIYKYSVVKRKKLALARRWYQSHPTRMGRKTPLT